MSFCAIIWLADLPHIVNKQEQTSQEEDIFFQGVFYSSIYIPKK